MERIFRKVRFAPVEECWIWQGSTANTGGYGRVSVDGKLQMAHRVVYELMRGPIPDGLTLDHLCNNPPCCNPWHCEPATMADNIRRGGNAAKTECKRGHPFTPENTYIWRGRRVCRKCGLLRTKAWQERKRHVGLG